MSKQLLTIRESVICITAQGPDNESDLLTELSDLIAGSATIEPVDGRGFVSSPDWYIVGDRFAVATNSKHEVQHFVDLNNVDENSWPPGGGSYTVDVRGPILSVYQDGSCLFKIRKSEMALIAS